MPFDRRYDIREIAQQQRSIRGICIPAEKFCTAGRTSCYTKKDNDVLNTIVLRFLEMKYSLSILKCQYLKMRNFQTLNLTDFFNIYFTMEGIYKKKLLDYNLIKQLHKLYKNGSGIYEKNV